MRSHLTRSPVRGRDQFDHVGFGFVRVSGNLRAQLLLRVVQRVLNER
jgi:hypothetical protein